MASRGEWSYHPLRQRPVPGFLWLLMSIFRFSALAPSTDREVPSQLYGTSHTIDWWRAAAVWGSALPGEVGGKRGCSKGPGHCPHPNGAWAAGGVAKEAPGLRAGGWGGVVRVPHHLVEETGRWRGCL